MVCTKFQLLLITGNQGGWTALMYATQFNYSNIVQFLVEHQAELDAQNEVCVYTVLSFLFHSNH